MAVFRDFGAPLAPGGSQAFYSPQLKVIGHLFYNLLVLHRLMTQFREYSSRWCFCASEERCIANQGEQAHAAYENIEPVQS